MKKKKAKLKRVECIVQLSDYLVSQLPKLSTEVVVPVVRKKTAEKRVVHVIEEMLKVSKLIKKYKIKVKSQPEEPRCEHGVGEGLYCETCRGIIRIIERK